MMEVKSTWKDSDSVSADDVFHLEEALTPTKESHGFNCLDDDGEDNGLEKDEEVGLCRKVIPELEEEENVCSICLDEFTDCDPSAMTVCGHGYHLQCIMQWAQRSRECPLCFHALGLEDEGLNSLLPFGEYVSPQQQEAESSMLANFELEAFLIRLATSERRHGRMHASRRRAQQQQQVQQQQQEQHPDGEDENDDATHHRSNNNASYSPPKEDSLIRSASQSLKSVKNKFAALRLQSFFGSPSSSRQ
eukprot:jgi/Picre1/35279/NNA_002741.t1